MSSIKRTMARAAARNRRERRACLLAGIDDLWLKELMLMPGVAEVERHYDGIVVVKKVFPRGAGACIDWGLRSGRWELGNYMRAGTDRYGSFEDLRSALMNWLGSDEMKVATADPLPTWSQYSLKTNQSRRKRRKRR